MIDPDILRTAEINKPGTKRPEAWNVPAGSLLGEISLDCRKSAEAGEITLAFPAWIGPTVSHKARR